MATDLERLIVTLEAQNTRYIQKLDQSEKRINRFRAQNKKALQGIAADFKTILGAVAVGLLVRKLVTLTKASAAAIDRQAKFADTIGLTTEQLAGYQFAAQISGVETEQFNKGITRLQKNIGDAEAGLATAVREFDKLGISAAQLKALSTDEQIKLIADQFNKLDSTVDRASVALNLFGRSGLALGKLFEEGSEGIAAFQQEALDLGIALSRVDASRVEAANDAMRRAGTVSEALGNALAVELAPIVAALADEFVASARAAGGFHSAVVSGIDGTATAIGAIADGVRAIKLAFFGAAAAFGVFLDASQEVFKPGAALAALLGNDSQQQAIASIEEYGRRLQQQFADALLEPLPSENIARFIADARAKLDAAAKNIEGRKIGGVGTGITVDTKALDAALKAEEKYLAQLKARGEAMRESVLTPNETYIEQLAELDTLLAAGVVTQETYNRALVGYRTELDAATPGIQSLLELNAALTDSLSSQEQALLDVRQQMLDLTLAAEQFPEQADAIAMALGRLEKTESDLIKSTEETADTLSVFAEQAARNMQDAFADFLFDPFSEGLDGMLLGFLKVIQRMLAEQLAAKLFGSVASGGFGGSDLITGAVGSLLGGGIPGFAGGGSTGNGPRSGGLDGEGGFLAMMHPQEVVTDLQGSAVRSDAPAAPANVTTIVALDAESINAAMSTRRGAQVQIDNVRLNRAQFRRALGL